MDNCIKEVVKINHHNREIYGVSYLPENKEKYPVVIFSHGFNGTNSDFAVNSEYLAMNGVLIFVVDQLIQKVILKLLKCLYSQKKKI